MSDIRKKSVQNGLGKFVLHPPLGFEDGNFNTHTKVFFFFTRNPQRELHYWIKASTINDYKRKIVVLSRDCTTNGWRWNNIWVTLLPICLTKGQTIQSKKLTEAKMSSKIRRKKVLEVVSCCFEAEITVKLSLSTTTWRRSMVLGSVISKNFRI